MPKLSLLSVSFFLVSCISAQQKFFNITQPDSTGNFYSWIQGEIREKTVGTYHDTLFSPDHSIHQIITYKNFEASNSDKTIWTIIDKFEFNEKKQIEKIEHWKTDNTGKICKCGEWQLRRKGMFVVRRPYPGCLKKGFGCDENGDAIPSPN